MELRGFLESGSWGKIGIQSAAAKIYWNAMKKNCVEREKPYSQLWIGSCLEGRCIILDTGEDFGKFIRKNPCVLGKCKEEFGGSLPFLLKVVSGRIASPVRFHPDKDQLQLHKPRCPILEESETKTKLIIALSCLEILSGLRPVEDIKHFLLVIPELNILIPQEKIEDYVTSGSRYHLKDILAYWLAADRESLRLAVDMYFERMDTEDTETRIRQMCGLLKRLHGQYPYDAGVFAPFFLNHILLNPNEAIFIKSGLPYSLVSGDSLICSTAEGGHINMALAPKIDVESTVTMMDFMNYKGESLLLHPRTVNDILSTYAPPVQEFAVDLVRAKKGLVFSLPRHSSSSIFLVTKGKAVCFIRPSTEGYREFKMGTSIFVFPNQKITFTTVEDLVLYHVYPNT